MTTHDLPPFRYYTDGEYEYRVQRGLVDSGTARTAMGVAQHGKPALVQGIPGTRMWKLADRPVVAPAIVTISKVGDHPLRVDDGSYIVQGQRVTESECPWTFACEVYLPNDEDSFDVAAKRLLGATLFAECEQVIFDAVHRRRGSEIVVHLTSEQP